MYLAAIHKPSTESGDSNTINLITSHVHDTLVGGSSTTSPCSCSSTSSPTTCDCYWCCHCSIFALLNASVRSVGHIGTPNTNANISSRWHGVMRVFGLA